MDLTSLIQSQLSAGLIDQLSQQLGGVDKEKTALATTGILTSLLGAMAKNASTPDGAAALNNALEKDHDGSILNDVIGMVTGQSTPANNRAVNGAGILNHVLGSKQGGVADMVSQMSGLDSSKTGDLMTMLAPVVMGMLGKAKRENNLDASGISDVLGGFTKQQKDTNPMMGMLTKMLDADGDGSIVDDVLGMLGKGVMGGLFGKRK